MPEHDKLHVDYDRWRPGTDSCRRQMIDEAEEHRDAQRRAELDSVAWRSRTPDVTGHDTEDVTFSRELSFVPTRRPAPQWRSQTDAMIEQYALLERLPFGQEMIRRLEDWRWMDRMHTPDQKQRHLEPLIENIRRDPDEHDNDLVFLLLVCEPVRRSVSRQFMQVRAGLTPPDRDGNWTNRQEARRLQQIEKQDLYDVTRNGLLEALFRYPSPSPRQFFPWLREAIAHRALDKLAAELPTLGSVTHKPAEAEALQRALHGLSEIDAPDMREHRGAKHWLKQIAVRDVYNAVEAFYDQNEIKGVCVAAVGRLPQRQQEVVNGLFFESRTAAGLADDRHVSVSTIYNHAAKARCNLRDDDIFFVTLAALGAVRDRARIEDLKRRHPDGRLPDGRRHVIIDDLAA